jgi:hypothetical protein
MKASEFLTREKANKGREVNIPGPDGKMTDQTFTIHSSDCDSFRRGKSAVLQKGLEIAGMKGEEQIKARERLNIELTALCVSGWSLDEDFSQEACADLMEGAPYLADFVERVADNRSLFFGKESES